MTVEERLCAFRFTLGTQAIPWDALRNVKVEAFQRQPPKLGEMKVLLSLLSTLSMPMDRMTSAHSYDLAHLLHVFQLTLQFSLWSQHVLQEQWEADERDNKKPLLKDPKRKKKKSKETTDEKRKHRPRKWIQSEEKEANEESDEKSETTNSSEDEDEKKIKKYRLYYEAIKEQDKRGGAARDRWHSQLHPTPITDLEEAPWAPPTRSFSVRSTPSASVPLHYVEKERKAATRRVKELTATLQRADHVIAVLKNEVKREKQKYEKLYVRAAKRLQEVVQIARAQRDALVQSTEVQQQQRRQQRLQEEEEEEQRRRRRAQRRREEEEEEEEARRRRRAWAREGDTAGAPGACYPCGLLSTGGPDTPPAVGCPPAAPFIPVSIYLQKVSQDRRREPIRCACACAAPCVEMDGEEGEEKEEPVWICASSPVAGGTPCRSHNVRAVHPHPSSPHAACPAGRCVLHRSAASHSSRMHHRVTEPHSRTAAVAVCTPLPAPVAAPDVRSFSLPPPTEQLSSTSSPPTSAMERSSSQPAPPSIPISSSGSPSLGLSPSSPPSPFALPLIPVGQGTPRSNAPTTSVTSPPFAASPSCPVPNQVGALSPNTTAVLHEMQKVLLLPRPGSTSSPREEHGVSSPLDAHRRYMAAFGNNGKDHGGGRGASPPGSPSANVAAAATPSPLLLGVEREETPSMSELPSSSTSSHESKARKNVREVTMSSTAPPTLAPTASAVSPTLAGFTPTPGLPSPSFPPPVPPVPSLPASPVSEGVMIPPLLSISWFPNTSTSPPSGSSGPTSAVCSALALPSPLPPPITVAIVHSEGGSGDGIQGDFRVERETSMAVPPPAGSPQPAREEKEGVTTTEGTTPAPEKDAGAIFPSKTFTRVGANVTGSNDSVASPPLPLSPPLPATSMSHSSPVGSFPHSELASSYVSLAEGVGSSTSTSSGSLRKPPKPLPTFSVSSVLLSPKKPPESTDVVSSPLAPSYSTKKPTPLSTANQSTTPSVATGTAANGRSTRSSGSNSTPHVSSSLGTGETDLHPEDRGNPAAEDSGPKASHPHSGGSSRSSSSTSPHTSSPMPSPIEASAGESTPPIPLGRSTPASLSTPVPPTVAASPPPLASLPVLGVENKEIRTVPAPLLGVAGLSSTPSLPSSSSSSVPTPSFLRVPSPLPLGPSSSPKVPAIPSEADLIPPPGPPSSCMLEDKPAVSAHYDAIRRASSGGHAGEEGKEVLEDSGHRAHWERSDTDVPLHHPQSEDDGEMDARRGGSFSLLHQSEGTPLFLQSSSSSLRSVPWGTGNGKEGEANGASRRRNTPLLPVRHPPRTASFAKRREQEAGEALATQTMVACRHCGQSVSTVGRHVHESNCDQRPVKCTKCHQMFPSHALPEHVCDLSALFGVKKEKEADEDKSSERQRRGAGDGPEKEKMAPTTAASARASLPAKWRMEGRQATGTATPAWESSGKDQTTGSDGVRGSSLMLRETQRELLALLEEEAAAEEAKRANKKA